MFLEKIFDFGGMFLFGRELFRKWGVLNLYLIEIEEKPEKLSIQLLCDGWQLEYEV